MAEHTHPKQKHKNTNVLENISMINAIKAIMSHIWQVVNVKSILKYFEFKYYFAKIAFFFNVSGVLLNCCKKNAIFAIVFFITSYSKCKT